MHFKKMRGFTLMEIITVTCIIIILIGFLFPAFRRAREQAKEQQAKAMIESLGVAVNMYYTDLGSYPSARNWGTLLVNGNGNYGPYMDNKDFNGTNFIDPWGNAYIYTSNANGFRIWTTTPDGDEID